MTAIVGILCRDGVVVGSDSSSTFSTESIRTIEQPTKKLDVIEDRVIVAGTGQVGLGQRFCDVVRKAHNARVFTKPYMDVGRELSAMAIRDFTYTSSPKGQYGALVAFPTADKCYLCEFSVQDFQPEFKNNRIWFVSMGCGQPITDPFLGLMRKVFWRDGLPGVVDATFVAAWTLQHAIDLNPGGIDEPIQLAVLRKPVGSPYYSARLLTDEELQEHNNNVANAEKYLGKYKEILCGSSGDASVP